MLNYNSVPPATSAQAMKFWRNIAIAAILSCALSPISYSQSNNNYVKSFTALIEGQTDLSTLNNKDEVREAVTYFDGLGRPIQSVQRWASPAGYDIVSSQYYDHYGREVRTYLPYRRLTSDGSYQAINMDPASYGSGNTQYDFYNNTGDAVADSPFPFADKVFENSPLSRVLEQGAPGESWQPLTTSSNGGHTVKMSYLYNTLAEQVKIWSYRNGAIQYGGYYGDGVLVKMETLDEDGNKVQEFTDKRGRVVLKRVFLTTTTKADTYYVYGDDNLLYYVFPPELSKVVGTAVPSGSLLTRWAFTYKYDDRRRMTEKRMPGAQMVYMVYDDRDRLVLTQDGNQRLAGEWIFTKYDVLNRPVATGIYNNSNSLSSVQNTVNSFYSTGGAYYEETGTAVHGYTNQSFPSQADPLKYLSVTYYDSYEHIDNSLISHLGETFNYKSKYGYEVSFNPSIKGQVTGSKTRVLDKNAWIYTTLYHDSRYRPIQTISFNSYQDALDRSFTRYKFNGEVLETSTNHIKGQNTTTTGRKMETDHMGRLLAIDHRIGGKSAWIPISNTEMDSNGNLVLTSGATSGKAKSSTTIPPNTDGGFEYVSVDQGVGRSISLSTDENHEFLLNLYNSPNYAVMRYKTTNKVYKPGPPIGTVYRIERVGGQVKYFINDELKYTHNTDPTKELNIIVSLTEVGSTLENIDIYYDQRIVENSYNEIGELISKGLHVDGTGEFMQQVDYQYNIRGWLTGINDMNTLTDASALFDDFYGTKLFYENSIDGSQARFNGNISAIGWKNHNDDLSSSLFTYSYDGFNRIKSARYSKGNLGTSWIKDVGSADLFTVDNLTYDLNGNILGLRRYTKAITGKVVMDNLVYNYGTSSVKSNKLLKVTDNGDDNKGFIDGTNTGNDYDYDPNGNLKKDLNKGISTITYNYLNLPKVVTKTDGKSIEYVYDAAGVKLQQIVNDTQVKTTDYLGEYIYEDGEISLIQHEEGRIVRDITDGSWEYQYHIKDHLGNVRTTFTSKPKEIEFTLNYEGDPGLPDDQALFEELNGVVSLELFDHTDATTTYTKSQRLTGANNSRIGSVLAIPVGKGDKISAEVYAKYEAVTSNPNTGLTALGTMLINSLTGGTTLVNEFGQASINSSYTGANGAIIGTSGFAPESGGIAGYLNVLFISTNDDPSIDASRFAFDQISSGAQQIGTSTKSPHDLLEITDFEAPTNGIAIIYVSNEQSFQTNIYFDDLKIAVNEHPIVQADNYYPFGLTFNSSQRVTAKENRFLYNEGTERVSTLDLNVDFTEFRVHDPTIARWWQIDPIEKYHESMYAWVTNNPVLWNDPLGLDTLNSSDRNFNWDDVKPGDVVDGANVTEEVVVSDSEMTESQKRVYDAYHGDVLAMLKLQKGDKVMGHRDGVPGLEDFFGPRQFGNFDVDAEGKIIGWSPTLAIYEGPDRAASGKTLMTMVKALSKLRSGKGYKLIEKLFKYSKNARLPTPKSDVTQFTFKGGKWVHKKTGAIYSQSKTSHGNPGNTGEQWKIWPKGTTDFGSNSKKSGVRVTIDGDGNVIGH